MIRFTVWKSDGQYKRFESAGHAEYAEAGSDVVCAAVSALVINAVNSIERFTDDAFAVEQAQDGGFLRVDFPERPGERAALLMDSLVLGIESIQADYGDAYITLTFEEV